jgi:hypothetical protein
MNLYDTEIRGIVCQPFVRSGSFLDLYDDRRNDDFITGPPNILPREKKLCIKKRQTYVKKNIKFR